MNMSMVYSLRFKITAITIAELLTAILCVFLVSFSIIQAENDRRSVEMMGLIAQDTRKSLEKSTESIEQSIEMVSNLASDSLDSVLLAQTGVAGINADQIERTPEQTDELDDYLAAYTGRIQAVLATIADHTKGAITYYYCIDPGVSTSEHGFYYSRIGRTGFVEQDPLDVQQLDEQNPERAQWYHTAAQRGRPSWIGPYTDPDLGDMPICSYTVPIYKSGTLIGVLGMDIPLDTLVSLVDSIKVYDHGFACLLDANGEVIYHPTLQQGSSLNLLIDETLLNQKDSGDTLIRYTADGESRQMSFTTLSNGMKLVIVAPTAEINASSHRLIRIILLVTGAIIALFSALTLLIMGHITHPLRRLTAASRRLAVADYDVELDYQGRDEVGELTAAFQRMRDQLGTYIEDLTRRVNTDDLTGLPSQRYFYALATKEKERLFDAGRSPIVLYFNLMGMKHFNRQYGFEEGNALIFEVSTILARHFGEQNTSRFAQDHFAVITSEYGLEEQLRSVFDDCRVAHGGRSLPVSVGLYPFSLEDVEISVACDRAKYACDQRRSQYYSGCRSYDLDMLRQVDTSRYVIDHLDQALDERWITVCYQPIVRTASGRVCDEEALSRWTDPHGGTLSPGDFIPALEDSGLIYRLDLYVLDRVLEKIRYQRAQGLPIVPHSINLSRSDFESVDIVEEIRRRVDAADVERSNITIEITESVIGKSPVFMKRQIERFQQLGFPVWMDDFGSGYSSLSLLQSIEFDLIKFDMSFLRIAEEGEGGKIILTKMMQMATEMGMDTICEGVETEEQVSFLRKIGCSKLQGYYFCKPISREEIIARYAHGVQIGYESPEEAARYHAKRR